MIKKTPKPIVAVKKTLCLSTKVVVLLLALLLIAILAVFYVQNKNAGSPLFVQSDKHASQDKTPLYVLVDPARHKDTKALGEIFVEHRPDIELIFVSHPPAEKNYVILGDPPPHTHLTGFDYALKEEIAMVGYMNDSDKASLAFRDFLLSSIAQDMLIKDGFDSIEPYRNASDAYFDAPEGDKKTADKTAAHAVSATALITAP